MIKSIIIYILITVVSIVVGGLVSFVIDLAYMLNIDDAHDMGLTNFFLLIIIFGLISQAGLFYFFFNITVLRYIAGGLFLVFLILLIRL